MKKIEEYIEKIYRNFDENDEETKVLKEETKSHLFEEVEELKKQGLTENESIDRAISNFGSEKAVISEMNLILKKQNKFSMILKKITLVFFITACIFLSIDVADELIHRNEPNPFTTDKNTTAYVFNLIENKIKNKDVIDLDLKNEITHLLDEFNKRNNNGLYYMKIVREGMYDVSYEYKKDITEGMIRVGDGGLQGIYNEKGRTWNVYSNRTDKQVNYDNMIQQEAWNYMVNKIPNRLGQISNYMFVVSAVLLCVYFSNKVYLKSTFSSN